MNFLIMWMQMLLMVVGFFACFLGPLALVAYFQNPWWLALLPVTFTLFTATMVEFIRR